MPNWCHNRLMIQGPPAPLKEFQDKAQLSEEQAQIDYGNESEWAWPDDADKPPFDAWSREHQAAQTLTFEAFVPTPSDLVETHSWHVDNWGTKWDACFDSSPTLALAFGDVAVAEDRTHNDPLGAAGDVGVTAEPSPSDATSAPIAPIDPARMKAAPDGTDGLPSVPCGALSYRFDTAWAPPIPVIEAMAEQHPELTFSLVYAEVGQNYAGYAVYIQGEPAWFGPLAVDQALESHRGWF